MRSIVLSAVLGVASLGFLSATPSSAEARPWWRSGYAPVYTYSYPAYSSYYGSYYSPDYYASYYTPTYTYSAYPSYSYYPTYGYTSAYYAPSYSYYTPRRVYYSTPGYVTYSSYSPVYYYP